jgi:hypothetical protein
MLPGKRERVGDRERGREGGETALGMPISRRPGHVWRHGCVEASVRIRSRTSAQANDPGEMGISEEGFMVK